MSSTISDCKTRHGWRKPIRVLFLLMDKENHVADSQGVSYKYSKNVKYSQLLRLVDLDSLLYNSNYDK